VIDRINGRVAVLLSVVAVLIVLLVGWFVFVSPQRSKAATLEGQVADTQDQIVSTQAYLKSPVALQSKKVLKRLQQAVPADVKMPEILRQLSWAAGRAHVSVTGITPGALIPTAGGQAVPITVVTQGHYFGIATFLHLLRMQASANGKNIQTAGRLYSVDGVEFTNGSGTTGSVITASIALNAFTSTPAATVPTTTTTTTTNP
jgi:Pilus assembly protein, PilO